MYRYLKELCAINGISGGEDQVREYILAQIKDCCNYSTDPLGNIIAYKKGKTQGKNSVMVSAHMDEVGMIVTGYKSDGMLRIDAVGGVDARVILGRAVTVGGNITGVIGTKAVHQQSDSEKDSAVLIDNLYVDIGANGQEDAEKHVQLGDPVYFKGEYAEFGDGRIKAKAIDDRIGCAIMIKLIQSELAYDTAFTFVTQEEVGLRGATAAAYTVNPDIAVVLEATTAGDLTEVEDCKQVCRLGEGPVIGFMDNSTIYDKTLYRMAFDLAEEHQIKCQTKSMIAGGNDAGAISKSRGGVRTLAISVPARYLHSPFCVIDKKDAEYMMKLTGIMLQRTGGI